jgi:hypothetical protein
VKPEDNVINELKKMSEVTEDMKAWKSY